MALNAPTRIVFILAVILAIISLLPMTGILTFAAYAAYGYWLLLLAFIVLAAGNLLKGL